MIIKIEKKSSIPSYKTTQKSFLVLYKNFYFLSTTFTKSAVQILKPRGLFTRLISAERCEYPLLICHHATFTVIANRERALRIKGRWLGFDRMICFTPNDLDYTIQIDQWDVSTAGTYLMLLSIFNMMNWEMFLSLRIASTPAERCS